MPYTPAPDGRNFMTDLQGVDFAFGGVIANAYAVLDREDGPEAFRRFLARETKSKLFRAENEDLPALVRRIAAKSGETPDLPLVAYCRRPGAVGGEERPQVHRSVRRVSETEEGEAADSAVRCTMIPLTLSYDMAFLAWDKLSLDRLVLAWHVYVGRPGRKHSRFLVRYRFGPHEVEIPAVITVPGEILTSNATPAPAGGRSFGGRTQVEVSTVMLYGHAAETAEETTVIGRMKGFIP